MRKTVSRMEREEAIRQLEDHINGHCPADFKRICKPELMCSILELLKEQQPRVLSKEELYALPDETDVWCEQRNSKRIFAMTTLGEEYFKLQPTFSTGLGLNDIRIWTARPTDEQRKAVPWETH